MKASQTRITDQIRSLGLQQDVTHFLLSEMSKPVEPQRIAALADSPEAAAEIYLVSAVLLDKSREQDRVYLDSLAEGDGPACSGWWSSWTINFVTAPE